MTHAKPRHDSLAPAKPKAHAPTARSLIPTPDEAPPDEAAAAYAAVEAELRALPEDQIEARRVDAAAAAGKAARLADELRADAALTARFRAVAASGEFDPRPLERLGTYGLALWYAAYMQGTTTPQGRARLPAVTREAATTLRARMEKLARYHFAEHGEEGPVVANLATLRSDRGLAQALRALADLYARHPPVVSSDRTNYRPGDEAEARRLSRAIVEQLDAGGGEWATRTAQAWTLLVRAWGDVQATGRWMLRATPEEAARRFPSLVAEARATARKPRAKAPVAGPTPGGEAAPATPPAAPAARPRRRRRRTR